MVERRDYGWKHKRELRLKLVAIQPLQDALKGVNKQASEATKELRQIDKGSQV